MYGKRNKVVDVFCSLGSNLGDREKNLRHALDTLKRNEISQLHQARIYETEPVGLKDQPFFLNTAIQFNTSILPHALLHQLLEIEKSLGRIRREKWGPRVIDIDIIFYGQEQINDKELVIPHPRYTERKFVLAPLAELFPTFIPPGTRQTIANLLEHCEDKAAVSVYKKDHLIEKRIAHE